MTTEWLSRPLESIVTVAASTQFVFSLAAPRGIASVYQGILPVENDMDLLDFEKKLRKLLLSVGGDVYLPLRKPPQGMVPIKKKAVVGEEGE